MSDLIVPPIPPDLRTLLDNLKADIFYNLNCHQVGVIESFDSTKQTASIRLSTLRVVGNEELPYPLLTDCPVMFPSGGGASLTFPVVKGDPCLVLFSDRDIDNWFTTGNVVAPNSSRAHSLSDGFVLVGLCNLARLPASVPNNTVRLRYGDSYVDIDNTGVIRITSSLGGQAKFNNKFAFNNTAEGADIRNAMLGLCDVLLAWVNTGGSTPTVGTLAALTSIRTYIAKVFGTP